jgi:hypothetical protein
MKPCQGLEFFLIFLIYLCPTGDPLLAKSAEACANLEDTSEGLCVKMRADMRIIGDLLFIWDVLLSFQNVVSVAAS